MVRVVVFAVEYVGHVTNVKRIYDMPQISQEYGSHKQMMLFGNLRHVIRNFTESERRAKDAILLQVKNDEWPKVHRRPCALV